MSRSVIEIRYNPLSYRWETWPLGHPLPASTHPSRDAAVIRALHELREKHRARILILTQQGTRDSILDIRNVLSRPLKGSDLVQSGR